MGLAKGQRDYGTVNPDYGINEKANEKTNRTDNEHGRDKVKIREEMTQRCRKGLYN